MSTDPISKMVTLLTSSWTAANTGNVTPTIANVTTKKRISGDSVLLHNISNVPVDNASGASSKKRSTVIALTARTFTSFEQAMLMKEEIESIVGANEIDPFGDQSFDIMDISDIQENQEETRIYFSVKILVKLEQFNLT